MMKKLMLIVISVGLTACGSNPNKVAAVKVGDEYYKPDNSAAMALDNKTNEKLVCEKRIVTGSHRKQKSCTTRKQKELDRKAAEETVQRNATMKTRAMTRLKEGEG